MDFLFKDVLNKDELLSNIKITTKNFLKGEVIFNEGTSCNNLTYIKYGTVVAKNTYYDGHENIIRVLTEKNTIGESLMFSTTPIYKADFVADSRVTVEIIDYNDILKLINKSNKINLNLYRKISDQLISINDHLKILNQKTVNAKICLFLYLEYQKNKQITFTIPFNKSELALYLNVERPTLSKEISKLISNNIISNCGHSYGIVDLKFLEKSI